MSKKALSLVEVIISLVIISVIIVALIPAFSASLKQTTISGQKSQSVRFMEFLGRLVVTGNPIALPAAGDTQVSWDYGELKQTFDELTNTSQGMSTPNNYKATVKTNGTVSLSGVTSIQYDIEVCFKKTGEEHCQQASTFGPAISSGSVIDYLPGIN